MALACTEMLCTTPLGILSIILNATGAPVIPWVSWEDTHFGFDRVEQFPAVIWRRGHLLVVGLTLTKWSSVFCAFIFFIFFGFAAEARRNYSSALTNLLIVCRFKKLASPATEKSG
jgi:pheromone a factor receptor